jgi:DnaJ-class molecular chaperone
MSYYPNIRGQGPDPASPNEDEIDALRWVACEACGGSGEIERAPIVGPYEDPTSHGELCPACEGTGRDCVEVAPVERDEIVPEYTDAQFATMRREAEEDDQLAAGTHYLDANGSLQPKATR